MQNSNHKCVASKIHCLSRNFPEKHFPRARRHPEGFLQASPLLFHNVEWWIYEQGIPKEASSPAHQEASKVQAMLTPQQWTAEMRRTGQFYHFKISLLCIPRIQTRHSGPRETAFEIKSALYYELHGKSTKHFGSQRVKGAHCILLWFYILAINNGLNFSSMLRFAIYFLFLLSAGLLNIYVHYHFTLIFNVISPSNWTGDSSAMMTCRLVNTSGP